MIKNYTRKSTAKVTRLSFIKRVLIFCILFTVCKNTKAQVELITASDGSFENATPAFIDNGWTTVQGADNRIWRVGTPAGAHTGTNAAYTGNATNYNGLNLARVNHFYRDITIPAGATNVQLKFYYRQPNVDDTYDYFYVSTTTTATTPIQGDIPDANYNVLFSNTATSYDAFTLVGPFDLTALAGTTVRLVFSAEADGVTPAANPAVDDISLSYIPSGYNMGVTAFASPAFPACYTNNETVSVTIVNSGNVDLDLSTTPLTVDVVATGQNPFVFSSVVLNTGVFAAGTSQNITIPGSYDMSVTGIYTLTATTTVANDAATNNDTYVMIFEKVDNPVPVITPPSSAYCAGGSVALVAAPMVAAPPLSFSNTTLVSIPDDIPAGINSTISVTGATTANAIISCTVNITHAYVGDLILVLKAPDGSSITLANQLGGLGTGYTSTVFTDTASTPITNGTAPFTGYFLPEQLLSTLTGVANGNWTLNVSDNALFDEGDLLSWSISFPSLGGISTYSWSPAVGLSSTTTASVLANPASTTTYDVVLTNNAGCTGYGSTTVTVNPVYNITQTLSLCEGNPFTVGTSVYNFTGVYTDVLQSVSGCDSTVISDLTFNLPSAANQTLVLCSGDSAVVGSNVYNTTGVYTDILTSAVGCDSTVTTDLTILPVSNTTQSFTICAGESILIGGINVSVAGVYTELSIAANGCDSIITSTLTVLPTLIFNQTFTLCNGDSIVVGNNTYNTSGIYSDTLLSVSNCDSIITTDLTMVPDFNTVQTFTICSGDSVVVGGNTYTTSGTFTANFISGSGCDSTIITNLTVLNSITATQSLSICNGDSVIVGTSIYTTAGIYSDLMVSVSGCDSIVITTLAVNQNPLVALAPFPQAFCLQDPSIALQGGTPAGGTFSGAGVITSPTFTPATAGLGNHIITYSFTDNNSCSASASQTLTVSDCTGLEETGLTNAISVFPNPGNGVFYLTVSNARFDHLQISVTDMQGKTVLSFTDKNVTGNYKKEINLQEQAKGMYFINLVSNNKSATMKLIVE